MDQMMRSFLERGYADARAVADASDLLKLERLDDRGQCCAVTLRCRGLVREEGQVRLASEFRFIVSFPDDYLERRDLSGIVRLERPWRLWHPGVRYPLVCPGPLEARTPLKGWIDQLFEMVTYQNYASYNGFNDLVCVWARANTHRLPVDRRPLRWRRGDPVPRGPGRVRWAGDRVIS